MTSKNLPLQLGLLAACALAGQAVQADEVQHAIQTHIAATESAAGAPLHAGGDLAFVRSELRQERRLKGAPYCADAVHETVQQLSDGNRIVHSQTSRICRDGEGRTRQEVERDGRRSVYLRDPVAQETWVLNPQAKTAIKLAAPALLGAPHLSAEDSAAWRDYAQRMREWAQKVREQVKTRVGRDDELSMRPMPPAPAMPVVPAAPMTAATVAPAPVVITQSEASGADAQDTAHREVHVKVLRVDAPMAADAPLAPHVVAMRALDFAPRGAGTVTLLGSKEIEGLKASGERTSWTIEAGKIGNDKPIVITRDVWTSPELGLTLSSRDLDPRSGEVNYRLQNIRRAEPDAALMKVPADFAVTTAPTPPRPPRAPAAPSAPGKS